MSNARTTASPPALPQNRASDPACAVRHYLNGTDNAPLFLQGDARAVLTTLPDGCVDCVITSPPYWGQRCYAGGGLGLEATWQEYIRNLVQVTAEVRRVLRPTGSFWLNLGDSYDRKSLVGVPWRVALALRDEQDWTLRNEVIWNKVKGGLDNSTDKLRNVHEHIFHFVRSSPYYYNADAIRTKPGQARVSNGAVISATGVSGVRYRRQIELSTELSTDEKRNAFAGLNAALDEVRCGQLSDFRMIIRGQQRATHGDSEQLSGRARELNEHGFYLLRYHPQGAKPGDVWDILPEDSQNRTEHFAPFPEDLCKIPLLATCPEGGVVLDPFAGTGTTNRVAFQLNRKSIGIEIAEDYLTLARERCRVLL